MPSFEAARALAGPLTHSVSTPFASERVMACLDPSTAGADVLLTAARLSSDLHAVFYAVYVSTPVHAGDARPGSDSLSESIRLAEHLGAVVVRVTADDQVAGLLAFARREGVTHIVVVDGTPPAAARTRTVAARLRNEIRGATLIAVPAADEPAARLSSAGGTHV
ncbi:MAG TPA: hypothetical protein VKE51_39175 [Vicinamibacterales bacterium]|nr:hypothetical protein [Vicinamibacterales bacterium]